ncbi:efflux RND transporter periplasmic adaptor subunit [Pseudaeromonas paramecii]|uniref:Efflux RND transporter periplasmic adaptor subunit n=1 Tax=Pseudaeromonas paramecii TaxID=2138166 RepID=A0ABP8PZF0_9GAMM
MKRLLLLGLPLFALLLFGLWWLGRPSLPQVSLTRLGRGELTVSLVNSRAGTLESCQRAGLSLPQGGVVTDIYVKEGDRVARGTPLLRLWQEDLDQSQRRLAQALARDALLVRQQCLQAELAQRQAERLAKLARADLAAQSLLDELRTQAQSQQLGCRVARAQVAVDDASLGEVVAQQSQRQLRAPFAGVVAKINSKLGEYMTPSPPGISMPPVVDLIDDGCLYVSAPMDEVDAARLKVGQRAWIQLDALPDRRFAAQVRRIAPYVLAEEKQARTVAVEADFTPLPADVPLLVGYSADLEVITDEAAAVLRLPLEALDTDQSVLRYQQGRLTRVQPELGLRNWHWVAVLGGLEEGDQLVLQPGQLSYRAGMSVEIRHE